MALPTPAGQLEADRKPVRGIPQGMKCGKAAQVGNDALLQHR